MSQYEVVYSTDPDWCPKCRRIPCACASSKGLPPPSGKTAKLRLEKSGRGGKLVTVVFELPMTAAQIKDLLRDLQKRCGTGGTVKGAAIEVQGDHRDRIEARLAELGLKVKRAGG